MMKDTEQMFVPIDEKLFVLQNQKISEMMTISLDPDIAVIEKADFVQLQGQVLLQGKYKKVVDNELIDSVVEEKAYIKDVQELHYNEVIFAHPFPVEITIAAYRIDEINDITVKVAHFDYEVIEPTQIHIKARLEIAGLQALQDEKQTVIEEENPVVETSSSASEIEKNEEKLDIEASQEKEEVLEEREAETEEVLEESKAESEEVLAESASDSDESIIEEAVETQAVLIGQTEDEADETESSSFLRELFVEDLDENERLTLYITQEKDTIETVATRYEISTYQLMKDNDLTEDILEAGQILKIR